MLDQEREDLKEIALWADDPYEREEPKEETVQLVIFRLAREWYGVDIRKVKEVLRLQKVTYLPSSPGHIAGIVNLRGSILSVTDLKAFFGLPVEEPSAKSRILAVESGILETGLIADEVLGSVEMPLRLVSSLIPTVSAEGAKYLEGQCHVDDKLVGIVSVEKILELKTEGVT